MKFKLFYLTLIITAVILINAGSNDLSEFVITPTEIASFTYGKRQCRIWASAANSPGVTPSQWQFRYDPIFAPMLNENKKILISRINITQNQWRSSFFISLDDDRARQLAFNSVQRAFPNVSSEIQRSNVFSLPVKSIKLEMKEITKIFPDVYILAPEDCDESAKHIACYSFDAPVKYFRVSIVSSTEEIAKQVENVLLHSTVLYHMEIRGSRQVKTNRVVVTFAQLKKSKFYANLIGSGQPQYISRDDLRKALRNVKEDVVLSGSIEDPERFDQNLYNSLLERWSKVSTDKFDEISWSSTYNGDDLKPDVITRELNKMFTYDEKKDQYKFDIGFGAKVKGSVVDQVAGEVSGKGAFKKDDLIHILKKHHVTVDISGNRIIAKSVDVIRINWSDFEDSKSFTSILSYLSGPVALYPIKAFIDLSNYIEGSPSLTEIVRAIVDDRLSVGMIISFWGTAADAEAAKERGFWICDGRTIIDPASPLNGKHTPNLINSFLRGSNISGTSGGNDEAIVSVPTQSITVKASRYADSIYSSLRRPPFVGGWDWGTFHKLVSTGMVPGSSHHVKTVPRYYSVIYLIKVRDSFMSNVIGKLVF